MSATSNILMIRPVHFAFNDQTAVNNSFQSRTDQHDAHTLALAEFDEFVHLLTEHGIDVTVIEDSPSPHTPDSIFPNNWISFHEHDDVVLYPMFAENRRLERKPAVLEALKKKFRVERILDLTQHELNNTYLEGTGSMVLDRENKIVYACLSPRTDSDLVKEFCDAMDYSSVIFDASDQKGRSIYHTNVLMCVADRYVVICLEAITDLNQRREVEQAILSSGKELIAISHQQMNNFAGNMLQLENNAGERYLVMSTSAFTSLSVSQLNRLQSYNRILHSSLSTIEANGGGSARCMMAEIYLTPIQ